MRFFLILFIIYVCSAKGSGFDCVLNHVKEAVGINISRMPLYAKITNNKSLGISYSLIGLELVSLFPSKIFDMMANKYRDNGVYILCEDFVDLSEIPEFTYERRPPAYSPPHVSKNEIISIIEKLEKAYINGGIEAFRLKADLLIEEMEDHKEFYCMTRHILESVRRSATLYPHYVRQASDKQLPCPRKLMWNYIKAQINILPLMLEIDKMAIPIQAAGTPILCRDLPFIPPFN